MKAFDRIIGYEGVKNELYQIIDMFKRKEVYEEMGAKLCKGILLYGAPGLGKTMLATAFIEECGVDTFTIRSNNNDREVIKDINNAFVKAKEVGKAIIFFDDIDKYCGDDDYCGDGRVFATIQSNLEIVKDCNVLIIATANNERKLPESLKRNGRFDRKIYINTPTNEDARKIIEFYMKSKKINPNLNFEDIGKMINYTSCADLETILNESAIIATYAHKDAIDIDDIVKAYVKDQYNTSEEEFECTQEEIDKTALHEAGHVVVSEVLNKGSVGFVTIQPAGVNSMRGFTHLCTELHRRPHHILGGLGGKVACEQFYEGRCASGCQRDLSKVYTLIKSGISDNGTLGFSFLNCAHEGGSSDVYYTRVEAVINAEMEKYSLNVKEILLKNKDFLFKVWKELSKKRVLLYSDIQRIRSESTITPFYI